MKLIVKVFIFFMIFIIVWTIVMALVLPQTVLKGFNILEEEKFEWEIERVTTGIDQLITKHENLLLDWAKWDDAYDYIQDGNSHFIDVNIVPNFFEDQEIDHILIFDESNQLLHGESYDQKNHITSTISQSMIKEIIKHPNQSGLIYINNQPIVFTALRVTDSVAEAEPKGLFVFAYNLEQKYILQLGDTIKEQVTIIEVILAGKAEPYEVTTVKNEDSSLAVIKLPYLNLDSYMSLGLTLPHDISILGKKTVQNTLIVFLISFFILSGFLYIWIRNIILKIETIISDVKIISETKDLTKRVAVKSSGELNILKNGINIMLDEIAHMNKRLTDYARLDPLTGIINRRGGFEQLEVLMYEAKEKNLNLTICFIDLNDLKLVNDNYGHQAGDEYLKDVCEIIEQNTRQSDIFCRLGGDEFLLIFHLCNEEHAEETLLRIQSDLKIHNSTNKAPYNLSISYGIETYDFNMSMTEYVEAADQKMYTYKQSIKEN